MKQLIKTTQLLGNSHKKRTCSAWFWPRLEPQPTTGCGLDFENLIKAGEADHSRAQQALSAHGPHLPLPLVVCDEGDQKFLWNRKKDKPPGPAPAESSQ